MSPSPPLISDYVRKPFPRHSPRSKAAGRYEIATSGRVFRVDTKRIKLVTPVARAGSAIVKIAGGGITRYLWSSIREVWENPSTHDPRLRPWIPPDVPIDPLTGLQCCSIADIKLIATEDAQELWSNGKTPADSKSIVACPWDDVELGPPRHVANATLRRARNEYHPATFTWSNGAWRLQHRSVQPHSTFYACEQLFKRHDDHLGAHSQYLGPIKWNGDPIFSVDGEEPC